MGVTKFYGRWVKKTFSEVVSDSLPRGDDIFLETLEFDMGGLLHECASVVYSYGDGYDKNRARQIADQLADKKGREQLELTFFSTVTDRISELTISFIKEINSSYKRISNLVIAMDGVAPFAKIAQQRTRRYRSALAPGDEAYIKPKPGSKVYVPPPIGFQTNSITPGTDLMEKFNRHMLAWISSDQAVGLTQNKIIFSSTNKRGEGEHKLFEFRREGIYGPRSEKGILCIYGLDADLIMLNSLDTQKRVYIIRERNAHTPKNEGNGYHAGIVNIDTYRDELVRLLTGLDNLDEMPESNYFNYVRDFILMCFFVGNDFLPHIMCMTSIVDSLDMLIEIYRDTIYIPEKEKKKKVGESSLKSETVPKVPLRNKYKPKKGHLTKEDGSIVWTNLLALLAELKTEEPLLLAQIGKSMKRDKESHEKVFNSKTIDASIKLTHFPETETKRAHSDYVLDFSKFRGLWYAKALGPQTHQMMAFLRANDIDPFSEFEVIEMCKMYLQGLQWNLMYYTLGPYEISRTWYYTHTQAPTFTDLFSVLNGLIENKATPTTLESAFKAEDPNFGPVHQLIAVMPPKSFKLINKYYASLLESTSEEIGNLSYIAPKEFKIDYESAEVEHQGLAILPVVDPWQIVAEVAKIKKPRLVNDYYLGKEEMENFTVECNHMDDIKYKRDTSSQRGRGGFSSRGREQGTFQEREQGTFPSRGRGGFSSRGRGSFFGRGRGSAPTNMRVNITNKE